MIRDYRIFIFILALLGLSVYLGTSGISEQPEKEEIVNDIDMNCGFTDDFAAFLAKSNHIFKVFPIR